MNKGNFTAKNNFPVSTYTYDFLQQMSHLAGKLAALGGVSYILSGCEVNGTNVSEGVVVINGEVLLFEAGTLKDKVVIQEVRTDDHFAGVDYPEAYILRTAKFADVGDYNWVDFVQVLTNKQLQERIESIKGDEPGIVKMWAGQISKIPEEYRLCNGDELLIADYPLLFGNVGTSFGGNGTSNFKLPDLRSRFVVGYSSSTPDYNSIGKTGGEDHVTLSVSQIPEHKHAYTDDINAAGKFPGVEPGFPQSIGGFDTMRSSAEATGTGTVYNTQTIGGGNSHENRPPYFVLAYIIKVK